MYSRSISYRTSFPLLTHLLSSSKDMKLTISPMIVIGTAIRYKLIPVAFIAVNSFRLANNPILKTVEINIDIGRPILINHGIA